MVGQRLVEAFRLIAAHLGVTKRQALRLVELGRLPTFREGRVICSTRPSLDAWLAEREAAALRGLAPSDGAPIAA